MFTEELNVQSQSSDALAETLIPLPWEFAAFGCAALKGGRSGARGYRADLVPVELALHFAFDIISHLASSIVAFNYTN